jgi:hypothetical protein
MLRITEFLDFVYRPEFLILENTTFWKLGLFPSSAKERNTSTLVGPLERTNFFLSFLSSF